MSFAEQFAAWASLPLELFAEGWEFVPLRIHGEVRAMAALQGTEIHFAAAPGCRVIAKHRTREFLKPLLDRRGYLTTRAVLGGAAHDFLTRLGFAHTWRDEQFDHYMLTALPFGREQ